MMCIKTYVMCHFINIFYISIHKKAFIYCIGLLLVYCYVLGCYIYIWLTDPFDTSVLCLIHGHRYCLYYHTAYVCVFHQPLFSCYLFGNTIAYNMWPGLQATMHAQKITDFLVFTYHNLWTIYTNKIKSL